MGLLKELKVQFMFSINRYLDLCMSIPCLHLVFVPEACSSQTTHWNLIPSKQPWKMIVSLRLHRHFRRLELFSNAGLVQEQGVIKWPLSLSVYPSPHRFLFLLCEEKHYRNPLQRLQANAYIALLGVSVFRTTEVNLSPFLN